jgi:hypothetical protein
MEGSLNPLQSMCQLQLRRMMHKAFGEICLELSGMEAWKEVDRMMEEHFQASQHCICSCGVCKYEDGFQYYFPQVFTIGRIPSTLVPGVLIVASWF